MTPLGVGARLRAARAAAGLTQTAVGEALDMGAATIANYESERTAPSLLILGRLAALYRVSCDWLITGHPRLPHGLSKPYSPVQRLVKPFPAQHRKAEARTAQITTKATEQRCIHGVPYRDRCPDCEQEAKERRLGP